MTLEQILVLTVTAPGVAFLLLGIAWLLGAEPRERVVARLTCLTFFITTLSSACLALSLFSGGLASVQWNGGMWFSAGEYAFQLDLIADHLSAPLLVLTSVLVGLVGLFSVRYMHRERGFLRFFILLHVFAFGSMLIFSAGSFDLLIGGWELVGISSALLVAFFQERREPVRNSIHVYSVYRIGDLGLLLGVFVLHYLGGTAEIDRLFEGAWPSQTTALTPAAATLTALLFLFAAAAKSAQVPFFGWLPRAMEGPTPSSAIFYGAISVHAGAYLLLRIGPALSASPIASAAVIAIGLLTALVGTALHRVVADAKSSIAYAAMTQLGIIFMEIGFGFPKLALAHIIGHAIVRTLQFLRAPSMLHDYHRVHAAAGGQLGKTGEHYDNMLPEGLRLWAYRAALDRAFYDAFVTRAVVSPAMALSRWLATF
ncbi:MAG: proton-conducting transporter membrane subunit [Acidobacteriota bacterium]